MGITRLAESKQQLIKIVTRRCNCIDGCKPHPSSEVEFGLKESYRFRAGPGVNLILGQK